MSNKKNKMVRKIICVGKTSSAVIIPKSWLKYHNLNHGDYLEITPDKIMKVKPITLEDEP